MKIRLILITTLSLVLFTNCSSEKYKADTSAEENFRLNDKTENLKQEINIDDPSGDFSPVKTIESRDGDFSFKSPCPSISKSVTTKGKETEIIKESIECNSNKVKLTATSYKDVAEITQRLKEIEKEKAPVISKENGYQILTFGNFGIITTNTKSSGFPDSVETSAKVSRNKIYKINSGWIIEL